MAPNGYHRVTAASVSNRTALGRQSSVRKLHLPSPIRPILGTNYRPVDWSVCRVCLTRWTAADEHCAAGNAISFVPRSMLYTSLYRNEWYRRSIASLGHGRSTSPRSVNHHPECGLIEWTLQLQQLLQSMGDDRMGDDLSSTVGGRDRGRTYVPIMKQVIYILAPMISTCSSAILSMYDLYKTQ